MSSELQFECPCLDDVRGNVSHLGSPTADHLRLRVSRIGGRLLAHLRAIVGASGAWAPHQRCPCCWISNDMTMAQALSMIFTNQKTAPRSYHSIDQGRKCALIIDQIVRREDGSMKTDDIRQALGVHYFSHPHDLRRIR